MDHCISPKKLVSETRIFLIIAFTLASLCSEPAIAEKITLRFLEWGYLTPYKENFEKLAAENGYDVEIETVQPFVTTVQDMYERVRAQKVDVVMPGSHYYKALKARLTKVLLPIDYSKMSNYEKLISTARQADYDQIDGVKYSVPITAASMRLAYNADHIKLPPTSYAILLDPQYKGRIGTPSISINAIMPLLFMMGYSGERAYDLDSFAAEQNVLQNNLNQLIANTGYYWHQIVMPDAMSKLDLTTSWGIEITDVNKQGQNWKFAPISGLMALDTLAIAAHLKNQPKKLALAYMLINYLISTEYLTNLIQLNPFSYSVNAEVAQFLSPETLALSHTGDPTYFNQDFLLRPLSERTHNAFDLMWKQAMKVNGREFPSAGDQAVTE